MVSSKIYIGIKVSIDTLLEHLTVDNWETMKSDFLAEDTTLVEDDVHDLNNFFDQEYNSTEQNILKMTDMKRFLKDCKKRGIKYFTSHSKDCELLCLQKSEDIECVCTTKVNFNKINTMYTECKRYAEDVMGISDYKIVFINHLK